jgi:glycosyltransferase involved in cell wall biosynthesis
MRVLFLHQNYPGQFVHLESALRREGGHELVAVVPASHPRPILIPRRTYAFDPERVRTSVRLAETYTRCVARGAAAAGALYALREEGFIPDVVLAHPGWGESLFVRDVWPDCRLIAHAEFYYTEAGAGFDPQINGRPDPRFRIELRTRNAAMTLALLDADVGVAPTPWQASVFPDYLRQKLQVAHEGIDTSLARPDPNASLRIERIGTTLRAGDEVVTFVNRDLEPHRGFHVFMRALPEILARRPKAHAIIVGADGHAYGPPPKSGKSWKETLLEEVGARLDPSRTHFTGRVAYGDLIRLLQLSAAHVYLTYPYVLSWSMLDAMSAGALVIGSKTTPVEDVIRHGDNGLLVDFLDSQGLAETVIETLAHPERYRDLRSAARRTIEQRFDLQSICLPRWRRLLEAS